MNDRLPAGLDEDLQQLSALNDDALLRLANSRLLPDQAKKLVQVGGSKPGIVILSASEESCLTTTDASLRWRRAPVPNSMTYYRRI